MMEDVQEPRRVRDPLRLRSAYMEWASPEVSRRQLQTHMEYYIAAEALYQQQHDLIVAQEVPLLVDRLSEAPAEQHEAIIAFKAFAYEGMVKQPLPRSNGQRKGSSCSIGSTATTMRRTRPR
jgi:PadR family transcriptional regulator, regulatory protein AphA